MTIERVDVPVDADIDQRRAVGVPLVYRHNFMKYVFDCPFYGAETCGMGSSWPDNPTEEAAIKAWQDHHALRHSRRPIGWPVHIPGARTKPAPVKRPREDDPLDVDPDQGALF